MIKITFEDVNIEDHKTNKTKYEEFVSTNGKRTRTRLYTCRDRVRAAC